MQQAEGSEAILWSRSHSTVSHWTAEYLLLGLHQQPYKVNAHASTKQTKQALKIFRSHQSKYLSRMDIL